MNQIELDQTTRDLLDSIRHSRKALCLFEMPTDLAEAAVWEIGKVLLDHQGLPLVQYNTYRWFLRELAKLLRTRIGWELALELELCLRKWVGFCLDPAMLQALLRECYGRIGAMTAEEVEESRDSTTKTQRHYHGQMTNDEVRMTDVTRSPNAPNDRRCTRNVPRTAGGAQQGEIPPIGENASVGMTGTAEGAGNG